LTQAAQKNPSAFPASSHLEFFVQPAVFSVFDSISGPGRQGQGLFFAVFQEDNRTGPELLALDLPG